MSKFLKISFLMLVLVVFVTSGCKEKDDTVVLKLAHGLDNTHPVHKAMEFLAAKAAEKSGGKLRIDIYPSEQLGSERECIEQLQIGSLAMTKVSSGVLEGFVDPMQVFGLPYLFRDSDHYWKVLEGPIGREILDAGMNFGLKGLCYYDSGARSFYTVDKQIKSPADLSGMKIRVMKSPMSQKMIQVMGGSATPIDWGELYTSLDQGVVDGAENNPPSLYTSRHYEICKYYTLDEHTRLPDVLVISKLAWMKLSPEMQGILMEAVAESVQEEKRLWSDFQKESMEKVQEAGIEVFEPDKELFREAVKPLWDEYAGTPIGELAKRIQEVK